MSLACCTRALVCVCLYYGCCCVPVSSSWKWKLKWKFNDPIEISLSYSRVFILQWHLNVWLKISQIQVDWNRFHALNIPYCRCWRGSRFRGVLIFGQYSTENAYHIIESISTEFIDAIHYRQSILSRHVYVHFKRFNKANLKISRAGGALFYMVIHKVARFSSTFWKNMQRTE